jgi:putative protease
MKKPIEIMAPVGSWESLHAAIQAGAHSIYFGLDGLNMRSHSAHNFTLEELPEIVQIAKENNVKAYVTLNAIIYDEDLPLMRTLCQAIKKSDATAVIASDIAVIEYAKSINLPVHISTQQNISNIEAVRFYSRYADVVVLARELTLEQIHSISQSIEQENIRGPSGKLVEIELFVHGALCVSISGKCYMSLMEHNQSANRGKCTQICRRKYRVTDEQSGSELVIDNQYVMSPKDLSTIDFVDQLIEAGVQVFKIEGRGKGPEYVHAVVSSYKEAVEAVLNNTFTEERRAEWKEKLNSVYNRGFWEGGYYLGKKLGDWTASSGSQATHIKNQVGKITNYFSNLGIAEITLDAGSLSVGDLLLVTGPTTGIVETKVETLHKDGEVLRAEKDSIVTLAVPRKVRKNDRVFILQKRALKVVS